MNQVIIIGRVGSDIELVITQSGMQICAVSLATSDGTKDKQLTNWHKCKAFGKTAEIISKFVKKGDRLGIVGKIQYGSYDNKEGVKVYTTDIIVNQIEFLQDKNDNNISSAAVDVVPNNQEFTQVNPDIDDLPF